MQKNKINSLKKLAVLGLAVVLSGSAVASAQMSEEDAQRYLQKTQPLEQHHEETLQERLRRLERERDEKRQQTQDKRQQAQDKRQQAQEKKQQAQEKKQQALEAAQQATDAKSKAWSDKAKRLNDEVLRLNDEALRLAEEAMCLYNEIERLVVENMELDRQIEALRAQIAREQQEEPVEEIVEVVPEDRDDANGEQPRGNRNGTVDGAFPQDAFRNMLRFHMPNQRQGTRGGMFNMMRPFGSKK